MLLPHSPIAVLDSGLGGLTVVRALRALLPGEDILYFGDTARVPYGSKSAATITGFVRQIIEYLLPRNPKHVVIACNTATALALPDLRRHFPQTKISGVIEPGANAAIAAVGHLQSPSIAVIGTEATIRSRAYERAIQRRLPEARLECRATPLLAAIIEEGRDAFDPLVRLAIRQYLMPFIQRPPDVLVLGCTHYPLLREPMRQVLDPRVAVIDSAAQCAQDVRKRLATIRPERPPGGTGRLECFVTDDAERFAHLAERFLGFALDRPTVVGLDELCGEPARYARQSA